MYVDNEQMVLRNDTYGPGARMCLSNENDGNNFRVTSVHFPTYNWNAYPELFTGCWYGVCSRKTMLPMPLSRLHRLTMTLWTRYPASTIGNDATDWWFGMRKANTTCGCHPNGAELMIWPDWSGQITGARVGQTSYPGGPYVTIGRYLWWFVEYRTTQKVPGGTTTWNYIQFRRIGVWRQKDGTSFVAVPSEPSFTNYNVMAILRYCEREGWIKSSWWATAFAAGNEVVNGGTGIHLLRYQLRIDGKLQR